MHGRTTGEEISNEIMKWNTEEQNIPLKKLVCMCTDGAPSMVGKKILVLFAS
jgi:hypothetical protein